MRAYISVADAAECTRRRGQGARGSGCGSGWDGASSGRTGLRVDTTGGAQDWVGCHGRDTFQLTYSDQHTLTIAFSHPYCKGYCYMAYV